MQNFIREPDLHIGIGNTCGLTSDDRNIDLVFDPHERFREVPRMSVTVTARLQVFDAEFCNRSRFRPEIGTVNDNEFFCHIRVKQRKNKVRAAKTRIYYSYIVGK